MGAHGKTTVSMDDVVIPDGHKLRKVPMLALGTGVVGLLATAGLATTDPDHFYFSYLTAFMFWLSIAIGGFFFVIIHHAVRAGWSTVVRRLAENFMMALPVMAVLGIPIILGLTMGHLFHWAHPGDDAVILAKSAYLNTNFFLIRYGLLFVGWTFFALYYYKNSVAQDTSGDLALTRKLQKLAPLGVMFFAFSLTVAAIDWIMSLDPHWFSTIFGVYYFAGSVVAINASIALAALWLQNNGLLKGVVTPEHYHDLGKYMYSFIVFWAYLGFSQYMLYWYANIPEETMWFAHRLEGWWFYVSLLLFVGHFVLPFFAFMSRHVKRNPKTLKWAALWLLAMQWLDMYWMIQPNFSHAGDGGGAMLHLMDLTSFIGIGGVVLWVFTQGLMKSAVVPVKDPRLAESLAFENF